MFEVNEGVTWVQWLCSVYTSHDPSVHINSVSGSRAPRMLKTTSFRVVAPFIWQCLWHWVSCRLLCFLLTGKDGPPAPSLPIVSEGSPGKLYSRRTVHPFPLSLSSLVIVVSPLTCRRRLLPNTEDTGLPIHPRLTSSLTPTSPLSPRVSDNSSSSPLTPEKSLNRRLPSFY